MDAVLSRIEAHPEWPVHADIFDHPVLRLKSRHPVWLNMNPVDVSAKWREDWLSAPVVNQSLVDDPTIRQPGFDCPRDVWTLLNRFRTGQGPCRAILHKWGLGSSAECECGQIQSMEHIVNVCPRSKFSGGLRALHNAEDWLAEGGSD